MSTRPGRSVMGLGMPWWLACGAVPASAQYPISKDAFSCQDRAARSLSVFVRVKDQCIESCERRARQGKNPFSDCTPPSFGGDTANCVATKAVARISLNILKGCQKECPSCYAGGDCATGGSDRVSNLENVVDNLNDAIYCSTGGDANVNACRERVVKAIGTYDRRRTKCYRDCFASAQKGDIPASDCAPPSPADAETATCLAAAESTAATSIDKGCFGPRDAAPPCYDGNTAPNNGTDWAMLARFALEQSVPSTYCGP